MTIAKIIHKKNLRHTQAVRQSHKAHISKTHNHTCSHPCVRAKKNQRTCMTEENRKKRILIYKIELNAHCCCKQLCVRLHNLLLVCCLLNSNQFNFKNTSNQSVQWHQAQHMQQHPSLSQRKYVLVKIGFNPTRN